MKILLDTHILLWALSNDPKLPPKARGLIEKTENEIFCSVISLWEVEIKHTLHPDKLSLSAAELADYCQQAGFPILPVQKNHILALSGLRREEGAAPHKDPFDRMLICQASAENMIFVTHDALLAGYSDPCIVTV